MPLYEYRCAKCGKVFEVLQKFSDKPLKRHPVCGGHVERLVSASNFQLKGGGWYASGYSKEPPVKSTASEAADGKAESKSDSKSESNTASKSESASESKPAPKSSDRKPAKAKA